MATTRSYRLNRIALELELAESARRAAWNAAALEAAYRERVAAGVAPMEPAELVALFQRDAAAAWAALAAMTAAQRINQAIETACWLEGQDRPITWGAILDKWESHLAENTGEKAAGSHAGAREDAIVCADASLAEEGC